MKELTPFEQNVIEVALDHLSEMHQDLVDYEEGGKFSKKVIDTIVKLRSQLNN
tara:strand:- start:1167 stop:1325 length:159 start_codon:yes stop_codon:yes gene_type:complete